MSKLIKCQNLAKPAKRAFALFVAAVMLTGCAIDRKSNSGHANGVLMPPTENHLVARNKLPKHDVISIGEKEIPVKNGVISMNEKELLSLSQHENVFYKRRSSRAIDPDTVEAIYRSIGFDGGNPSTSKKSTQVLDAKYIFWVEKGDLEDNIGRLARQAGWNIKELHLPFSYFVSEASWMIGDSYVEILNEMVSDYPVVAIVKEEE